MAGAVATLLPRIFLFAECIRAPKEETGGEPTMGSGPVLLSGRILVWGAVSHERVCFAQPIAQDFAGTLRNLGKWNDDALAHMATRDYREGEP